MCGALWKENIYSNKKSKDDGVSDKFWNQISIKHSNNTIVVKYFCDNVLFLYALFLEKYRSNDSVIFVLFKYNN